MASHSRATASPAPPASTLSAGAAVASTLLPTSGTSGYSFDATAPAPGNLFSIPSHSATHAHDDEDDGAELAGSEAVPGSSGEPAPRSGRPQPDDAQAARAKDRAARAAAAQYVQAAAAASQDEQDALHHRHVMRMTGTASRPLTPSDFGDAGVAGVGAGLTVTGMSPMPAASQDFLPGSLVSPSAGAYTPSSAAAAYRTLPPVSMPLHSGAMSLPSSPPYDPREEALAGSSTEAAAYAAAFDPRLGARRGRSQDNLTSMITHDAEQPQRYALHDSRFYDARPIGSASAGPSVLPASSAIRSSTLRNPQRQGSTSTSTDTASAPSDPSPAGTIIASPPVESPSLDSMPTAPPDYEAHSFPVAPPGFQGAAPRSPRGAARQSPAAEAATAAAGGRFPRWRGWLEKRALERHYERAALEEAGGVPSGSAEEGMRRKKSWGAGVHDPDAVDEPEEDEDEDNEPPIVHPPLHLHQYGLRFIPHISSQPLCSVYLEVPPPPPPPSVSQLRLPRGSGSATKNTKNRNVLLVGTADGLWAMEMRKPRKPKQVPGQPEAPEPEALADEKWNGNMRCVQVWSGLGLYQLAVLATSSAPAAPTTLPFFSRGGEREASTSSGILLALCAPSTPGRSHHGLSSSSLGHGHASSHGHGNGAADSEGLSAAQFGSNAGGGIGKISPPAGNGVVRMWNLEELRQVVAHALDAEHARPLDLLGAEAKRAKGVGRSKFGSKLRKAWASLGEPSAERSQQRAARKGASEGQVDPLPSTLGERRARSRDMLLDEGAPRFLHEQRRYSAFSLESFHSNESGEGFESDGPGTPRSIGSVGDEHQLGSAESAHLAALRLALNSVPITPPSSSSSGGLSHSASHASLFGDDVGSGGGGNSSSKGKDRDASGLGLAPTSSTSKGIIFFAVTEAAKGAKAAGTWYLAVGTSKSLLLYEALPPKRGATRAWGYLKELYCPFPPKAIAFCFCSTDAGGVVGSSGLVNSASATKLSVKDPHSTLASAPVGAGGSKQSRPPGIQNSTGSILRPQHGGGAAGPSSWGDADLSMLVSFGRRAVIIRISDSNVRELELAPVSAPSAVNLTRPPSRADASMSENGHLSAVLAQAKRLSIEASRAAKASAYWLGMESIEARVVIRQHQPQPGFTSQLTSEPAPIASAPPNQRGVVPQLAKWTQGERSLSSASSMSSLSSRDKALPPAPAPQGLSFESRNTTTAADRLGAALLDDSDSDDDDMEESGYYDRGMWSAANVRGVTLRDSASPQHSFSAADAGLVPVGRARRRGGSRPQTAESTEESGHVVVASLALLSKGTATHILPLPLPADLARPRPLAVLHWTEVPLSVTAWARVVGLERARSSGAVPTSALGARPELPAKTVVLHVSLTALAFLPSRVEMKRVTVRCDVKLPFSLARDSELSLRPAPGSPQDAVGPQPVLDPAVRSSLAKSATSVELEHEYLCGMLVVAPHTCGAAPTTTGAPAWRPPEAHGDGGAWAFDWRGGDDYRLLFVGAEN